MVLGKKVAIFDWEWGRNSAPRDGQKIPWLLLAQLKYGSRKLSDKKNPHWVAAYAFFNQSLISQTMHDKDIY